VSGEIVLKVSYNVLSGTLNTTVRERILIYIYKLVDVKQCNACIAYCYSYANFC